MPKRNNKFELTRIYQGRITDVKILSSRNNKGKEAKQNSDNWMALENWEEKIWGHHCLFQDAVNYYAVGLALMADPDDETSEADLSPMEKFSQRAKEATDVFTMEIVLQQSKTAEKKLAKGSLLQGSHNLVCPLKISEN